MDSNNIRNEESIKENNKTGSTTSEVTVVKVNQTFTTIKVNETFTTDNRKTGKKKLRHAYKW